MTEVKTREKSRQDIIKTKQGQKDKTGQSQDSTKSRQDKSTQRETTID
jgi:hypothetical protein